jgi:hypothetical protein
MPVRVGVPAGPQRRPEEAMANNVSSPRKAARVVFWTGLVAVPAFAAAAAGPALSAALSQDSAVAVAAGFTVPVAASAAAARPADDLGGLWQKTGRFVYNPPERSTYFPPPPP